MNAAESTKNLLIYCTQFSKQYAYTNYQAYIHYSTISDNCPGCILID